MRYNMLTVAMAAGLSLAGLAIAEPSRAAEQNQNSGVTTAQLQEMKAQIASLQAQLDALLERTDAQSDINVANAETGEAAKATQDKIDKLAKVVNDTQLSGKMFFDLTNIDQTNSGVKTNASGVGFDVKRFYLGVSHKFDDTWSVNLTTD